MSSAILASLTQELPPTCRQLLLVLASERESSQGLLWRLERADALTPWRPVQEQAVPVSLGRGGLAWGSGEHAAEGPAGFPEKREGDGCSPAGVFRLPAAFGSASSAVAGFVRLPYLALNENWFGVDDSGSVFYNEVVDATKVERDWGAVETMLRPDGLYEWGALVGHNPTNRRGGGSCIFLHVWRGPGEPTAGCTAMAVDEMRSLLAWLDPEREPRLLQAVSPAMLPVLAGGEA